MIHHTGLSMGTSVTHRMSRKTPRHLADYTAEVFRTQACRFRTSAGARWRQFARNMCAFVILVSAVVPGFVRAATPAPYGPEPQLQTGLHYYMIKDLRRGTIERAKAGDNGFAVDSVILAPDSTYRIGILQASTLKIGFAGFRTPGNGQRFNIPRIMVLPDSSPDSDADGLHDLGESILGTDPRIADTDGDGVNDAAEVQQGTNPLDGKQVQTGVIGTLDTPGTAVDICALNDLVIIADAAAGISVLNVFNAMSPTLIAQVDTPGIARAVASSGNLIAVADDTAGLAIVDISDPPAARITAQIALGSAANAVAVAGNTAFVGLISGLVASVDLLTGEVLDQLNLSGAVHDLAISGDQ